MLLAFRVLVAEHPGPQTVNLSIMVGFYIPQKVKGFLLNYYEVRVSGFRVLNPKP